MHNLTILIFAFFSFYITQMLIFNKINLYLCENY